MIFQKEFDVILINIYLVSTNILLHFKQVFYQILTNILMQFQQIFYDI